MAWLGIALLAIMVLAILLLLFLLFAPFYIEVDTRRNLYRIRLQRLAHAALVFDEGSILVDLDLLWWHRQVDLLQVRLGEIVTEGEKELTIKGPKREYKIGKSWRGVFKKTLAVLKSFKTNQCYITFDMGDVVTNGLWYPVFWWLSQQTDKTVLVNFVGEEVVVLEMENNLARIAWALIKS